jgi:prephenate dehydrogenase
VRTAAILGTGLIGSSIGLGLRAAGWRVIGWDPDAVVADRAFERGAVTEVATDFGAAVTGPLDLVVLAGPPGAIATVVRTLDVPGLVIDVAGVKAPIVAAARPARFVGTHPMAGRESTGPDAASAALFRGAAWVVVTDGAAATDIAAVEEIIVTLGARPVRMTAAQHDRAVAAISHLPQVLAATLVTEAAERTQALDLAAGSFRDLTRVAASDPVPWAQLLGANREAVVAAVEDLRRRLAEVVDELDRGDDAALEEMLTSAREHRRALAPPVVAVRVVLADQPGELAKVGHALEASEADIRDLQLRHAPHGGGGVLTLSVRPGEAEALRDALIVEGLLLAD